jgi:hypothetical protein
MSAHGQQFIARALLDSTLQTALANDTDNTLADPAYNLTPADKALIKQINFHEWSHLKLSKVTRHFFGTRGL